MTVMRDQRSLGELFSELSQEASTLFRQEVQLAKVEISQKASEASKEIAFIGAGGAIAYAGFLALIAAAIIGFAEFMPMWLSALLVGVIIAGIGYVLMQKGISALKEMNPAPRRTIETLKEDKEWLKQQVTR
jgi:xanthine/uracil permease